jgi:hypothetical protein
MLRVMGTLISAICFCSAKRTPRSKTIGDRNFRHRVFLPHVYVARHISFVTAKPRLALTAFASDFFALQS